MKNTTGKMPSTRSTFRNSRATVSGPAMPDGVTSNDILAKKAAGTNALAAKCPFNSIKPAEFEPEPGAEPPEGQSFKPSDPIVGSSTVSESNTSDKTDALDAVRVDPAGATLTTNQGVPVADNQSSLKAGLRGPTLLEDFILREKITHFDHERIPERIVHARGSAAHGFFECTKNMSKFTRASLLGEVGKQTPVFVRFSTVLGERGSTDTARDVRGFAVKFYTDEGNWDLVGNNMPVFFIQDAMKFPDLVHAAKPEPHHAMPQAGSAHDTFWDFASLMPEITHMLMWAMSDRAIPRSYRTMQGFGVHTYRLVNANGESRFVKFHWTPKAGTHSLVWDEAVKISGADSDFHRRDLWEAIEAGAYPEWELGLQIFTEEQAEKFTFDVLDATKIVPEELVPIVPVGRMVLNRNPDNFFAETEQVAFCTSNVVRGIDFTNDPLLQGRNFSYLDTQLLRLGGPNFNQIPINAPLAQVHNNQRDGFQQHGVHRGRANYEPNSLGGGCPFQAGMRGLISFPQPVHEDKLRAKPEKFAEHFAQATLFWRSQSPVEQSHIAAAFRFELSRVQVPAVRQRIVGLLANVASELAEQIAAGLGIAVPPAQPAASLAAHEPEIEVSAALSLFARPGENGVRGRRVALLVADGVEGGSLSSVQRALVKSEAVPRFVGGRLGTVRCADGTSLVVEATLENAPSVLWDAVVVPGGEGVQSALLARGRAVEFLRDQYRHCKPMLFLGEGETLLDALAIPVQLADGQPDPGLIIAATGDASAEAATEEASEAFIAVLARHRVYEREVDPPQV
jgi:catalase